MVTDDTLFDDEDPDEPQPLPLPASLIKPPSTKLHFRKVERMAYMRMDLKGHVTIFKAECETMLTEGHGLRQGDREFLERLQATAVQPYRHAREPEPWKGLAVFTTDQDWRHFQIVRRRFCQVRAFKRLRENHAASRLAISGGQSDV